MGRRRRQYWGFAPYVTVAEKKERSLKQIRKLKKKNPDIQPVVISGHSIASSWWGKAWNGNLERYADYAYRLERGRSYVRHGAVLDLGIEPGKVNALVQGTDTYQVTVRIKPIAEPVWQDIQKNCRTNLSSVQDLLAGRFPDSMGALFMAQGSGLFPSPDEIDFDCSCPDWASMCKHVAASLYGIGARLDNDPGLFFTLRKVDMGDLIAGTVAETSQRLIKNANRKSSRVIQNGNLSDLFGIDFGDSIEEPVEPPQHRKPKQKQVAIRKQSRRTPKQNSSPRKKGVASTTGPTRTSKTRSKTASRKNGQTMAKAILRMIAKAERGVSVREIRETTEFGSQQVSNVIHRLFSEGRIEKVARGIYQIPGKADNKAFGTTKNGTKPKGTITETVYKMISRNRKGIPVSEIRTGSGLDPVQVSNSIQRLKKEGRIRAIARGIYQKV